MSAFSIKRTFAMLSLLISMSACGNNSAVLPDDPENEPVRAAQEPGSASFSSSLNVTELAVATPEERAAILKLYDYLDPQQLIPNALLEEAVLYYHKNKTTLKNAAVLSVLDFSKRSTEKRLYVVNMKSGSVWSLHVAHGKGSDSNHDGFAESFSNVSGSNASSLGFYRTAETYQGKHGYSLRLDGLSSTNSNARARAVVIHGASYVQDTNVVQGRSWGCPAVSMENHKKLIDLIKGGSLIYAAK